jgi:hypothetical protein
VNAAIAARVSDLRAQARRIRTDDREMHRLLSEAFEVIDLLLAGSDPDLGPATSAPSATPSANGPASDPLCDMAELVGIQQREMDELTATIERVSALVEFSGWAARSAGSGEPVVRTDDLRAALLGPLLSRPR